ncbi:hypothetical protein LCGC14_1099150 [marine sediment metagenome]|uniref:Uncharacterized protein n=1 Tax=marine sediment metagenome TaxID=412755 RepID=A0A0F9MXU5_9ZZZZ
MRDLRAALEKIGGMTPGDDPVGAETLAMSAAECETCVEMQEIARAALAQPGKEVEEVNHG